MIIQPVILTGGSGKRLWPLSTSDIPKPFISFDQKNSLFQKTLSRVEQLSNSIHDLNNPIIVCNQKHESLVINQTEKINAEIASMILEPKIKNTAPALTLAALLIKKRFGDGIMISMHSDQWISNNDDFSEKISDGIKIASNEKIVLIGVDPTEPNTEYGYLNITKVKSLKNEFQVKSFIEKPSIEDAEKMIISKNYLWNSGNFILKSSLWLRLMDKFEPKILKHCENAMRNSNINSKIINLDISHFSKIEPISIDYAVLEKMRSTDEYKSKLSAVKLNSKWTDLGEWYSIWKFFNSRDKNNNFFQGEIDYTNVKNSLLISKKNSITAKNISDIFLIENNGKILIQSNHKARKFDKPWGFYEILSETQGQKIKKLTIFGGECTSLQKHKFRSEHWIITQGVAKVTVEEDTFELSQNSSIFIPKGTKHRIENHNQENLCLLEIQTGVYLEEDDIIRFDDKYAR